jgi:hypothetical protein
MKSFNTDSSLSILEKWTCCCLFLLVTTAINQAEADDALTNDDVFAE